MAHFKVPVNKLTPKVKNMSSHRGFFDVVRLINEKH